MEWLKKDLTKRYNQTLTDIEDIRNALAEIGNDEKWLEWIDEFSNQMKKNRNISDPMKKELLKIILKDIIVEYDQKEKFHRLTINFKLPVAINNDSDETSTTVTVKPPSAGRKARNQNEPVGDYSTVTDLARLRG